MGRINSETNYGDDSSRSARARFQPFCILFQAGNVRQDAYLYADPENRLLCRL